VEGGVDLGTAVRVCMQPVPKLRIAVISVNCWFNPGTSRDVGKHATTRPRIKREHKADES